MDDELFDPENTTILLRWLTILLMVGKINLDIHYGNADIVYQSTQLIVLKENLTCLGILLVTKIGQDSSRKRCKT
jgi:hypothetical protein